MDYDTEYTQITKARDSFNEIVRQVIETNEEKLCEWSQENPEQFIKRLSFWREKYNSACRYIQRATEGTKLQFKEFKIERNLDNLVWPLETAFKNNDPLEEGARETQKLIEEFHEKVLETIMDLEKKQRARKGLTRRALRTWVASAYYMAGARAKILQLLKNKPSKI